MSAAFLINEIPSHNQLADLVARGDWSRLATEIGFRVRPIRLANQALAQWGLECLEGAEVQLLYAEGCVRLILVDGDLPLATMRSAMERLHRRNPTDVTLWWWVNPESLQVGLVCERDTGDHLKLFTRRMTLSRQRPDPVGLKQLENICATDWVAPDERDQGAAVRRHLEGILEQETLTREFFQAFKRGLDLLQSTMRQGPSTAPEQHDVALLTLLRVLFLYFLQSRGALNKDPYFLIRAWRGRDTGRSFYRGQLRTLFFGALNTPLIDRTQDLDLAGIPFLNGGLFEPSPVECEHPDLDWPDSTFQNLLEDLFEHYHFAITEASADDEDRVIDPEMLGKVFEGLMFGDARLRSGTFYTPRHIVREMVSSALHAHLLQHTGLHEDTLEAILQGQHPGIDERDAIRDALQHLTILDPAVGTGAFLLEALRQLSRLWSVVDGNVVDHVRMRDVIHNHLHGVDINPTATRLCELRLWIALLVATPHDQAASMPPLPNLSHRIASGQSLIDPEDIGTLRASWGRSFGANWRHNEATVALRNLQDRYLNCHGKNKPGLQRQLQELEKQVYTELLDHKCAHLQAVVDNLSKVQQSRDLFGNPCRVSQVDVRHLEDLKAQISRIKAWKDDIQTNRKGAPAFSYALRFPHVAARGGFDIIITNPPWVRSQRIASEELSMYRSRFSVCAPELWEEANRRGIRHAFGSQVDLASIFLERALELLRPGGRICALVPAKMLRSLHGTSTRRLLSTFHIERIIDYSDAEHEMFDATTYPALIQIADQAADLTDITVWHAHHTSSWKERLPPNGEPWWLVPPHIDQIFSQMSLKGTNFLTPTRGVFTGANHVFIRNEQEFIEIIGDCATPFLRPVLTGKDPGGTTAQRILWLYDYDGEPLSDVPELVRDYFELHREILEERTDHDPRLPLWQVFRVQPHVCAPKIVWRDIATHLETTIPEPEAVPLNTVYYIPCEDREVMGLLEKLLNSIPIRAFARAAAERARGGYRRHFAWVIRLLPIPDEIQQALTKQLQHPAVKPELWGITRQDEQHLKVWLQTQDIL